MSPGQEDRGTFRRNVIIIAALHVLLLGGLWLFAVWRNSAQQADALDWLDGGGDLAASEKAQPTPEDDAQPDDETPTPAPEQTPPPDENAPPSQIVLPGASPAAITPTPRPTPKPTPTPRETPTPKEDTPTPKPRPKPSPSHKPKPKSSTSPRKHPSPKPSAHKSHSPDEENESETDEQAAFQKATDHSPAPGQGDHGTVPGSGGGNRGGKGHAGGGSSGGDFSGYYSKLYQTFYNSWDQPTSILTPNSKFSALVKIRIEKDGAISDVSLDQPSGNELMDQSVMEAAHRVSKVDPLPEGLGDGGSYEVKINFELDPQSQ